MRLTVSYPTLAPLFAASLLFGCVVDNGLKGQEEEPPPFDTGVPWDTEVETGDTPTEDEVCDGIDNNADGRTDEGFPDANANGRADCLDQECPALQFDAVGTVTIDANCEGTTSSSSGAEIPDAWAVKTKWSFRAPAADASASNSYSQPVIGNLNDDNGDGVIDEDDNADVVVNAFGSTGYIVAINGADGTEEWSYRGSCTTCGVIIADIDNDGKPDVVGYNSSGKPIALDGDGNLKWTASRSPSSTSYPLVTTADLDEDGVPEVIADDLVLDGPSGSVLFSLNASVSNPYRIAAVADVDNDGDQEIFMTGTAYDSDGSVLWTTGEVGTYGFWPVIVNADSDNDAEIGFVGKNWTLWEPDGTKIFSKNYGATSQPGPPCAGDFDGDGITEVAWPAYQTLVMYELDGTAVWSVPINDTSGLAGCSGFDVNNDGALEVLFADQDSFNILDGATGATNYRNGDHASGTVFEYPSVADMDADGHAEIVLASNYGATWGLLNVFEHDGVGWPAAGTTWGLHDFAITNLGEDGHVPQNPEPYWTKYNVYRARVAADDPSTPDLTVEITDICLADCVYGPVQVGVQVANRGGMDLDAGAYVSLYSNFADGTQRLIGTQLLPAIAMGMRGAGLTFDVAPSDVGEYGFTAVADDNGLGEGAVSECDEDNNVDIYADALCP